MRKSEIIVTVNNRTDRRGSVSIDWSALLLSSTKKCPFTHLSADKRTLNRRGGGGVTNRLQELAKLTLSVAGARNILLNPFWLESDKQEDNRGALRAGNLSVRAEGGSSKWRMGRDRC